MIKSCYLLFRICLSFFMSSVFLLGALPSLASTEKNLKIEKLVFCHEDENAYPWVFKQGNETVGLDIIHMSLLQQALSIPIELRSLPWKQCLLQMQLGQLDGAIAASYKEERLSMGRYPRDVAGELDQNRRLHMSGYSLFRLKKSKVQWTEKGTIDLVGRVGIQSGYSIGDRFSSLKVPFDESKKGPETLLDSLIKGEIGAVALQSSRGNYLLKAIPHYKKLIEEVEPPISHKAYYLMLSHKLVVSYPVYAEEIWSALAEVRDSAAFKAASDSFWQGK